MAGKNITHLGLRVKCRFMLDCDQPGISLFLLGSSVSNFT